MAAITDNVLRDAAAELGAALLKQSLHIATAESCTGGWVAKALTDIAGSSDWLECGLVTYSNAAKIHLLGVTDVSLERHGAVSEPVVREMVAGTLASTGAQVAVAISGIAGPGGGSPEKPVGTVWFSWGRLGRETEAVCEIFKGDRDQVRRQAVLYALQGVRGYLEP